MAQRDLLDWTLAPAPDDLGPAEGPGTPPPPLRRPRRLPRWAWLAPAGLAIAALLLALALPRLEAYRTRRAIAAALAAEEQARLSGDWAALPPLLDDTGWGSQQAGLEQGGIFPPSPLLAAPGYQPGAGRLGQLTLLNPQTARAEVIRSYTLAGGQSAEFGLAQFYRYDSGHWLRTMPPYVSLGPLLQRHGQRIDLYYYPADEPLAIEMQPELDALLVQACQEWACPNALRVQVHFKAAQSFADTGYLGPEALFGSLTFQMLVSGQKYSPSSVVMTPAGENRLYPANAAASDAAKQTVAVQVLLSMAQQVAPDMVLGGHANAFLYALLVRQAVRLGLAAPAMAQASIANPLFSPAYLWSLPSIKVDTPAVLPEALVILNNVLAGQPVLVERRLMATLADYHDVSAWLADGLTVPPEEVVARLQAAVQAAMPPVQRSPWPPDLALTCPSGPLLANLAGQTQPLFAGEVFDARAAAWSPSGARLALTVGGRLGVVDPDTGRRQWAAPLAGPFTGGPTWASESVLAYGAVAVNLLAQPGASPVPLGLEFFDAVDSGHSYDQLPLYDYYLAAPAGPWAVLISWHSSVGTGLALLPQLGGQPLPIPSGQPADTGTRATPLPASTSPIWAPDGLRLAFARYDQGLDENQLVITSLPSRESRVILNDHDSRLPAPPAANNQVRLAPAWSPRGDQIALVVQTYTTRPEGWVALIAPDGSSLRLLVLPALKPAPGIAAFSADGLYLALEVFNSAGQADTAIYDPSTGQLLRLLPGLQPAGWSPTGHTLALASPDAVYLLREPSATPEPVGPAGCTAIAWRAHNEQVVQTRAELRREIDVDQSLQHVIPNRAALAR